MEKDSAQQAFDALLAGFEENKDPDWDSLAVWSDACEDLGKQREAWVARWMLKNVTWPKRFKGVSGFVVWEWWNPRLSWRQAAHDHTYCPLLFNDVICSTNTTHSTSDSFLEAFEKLNISLYLHGFEQDPTPDFSGALECANWLENKRDKTSFLKGLRWMIHYKKWPKREVSQSKYGDGWTWEWGRDRGQNYVFARIMEGLTRDGWESVWVHRGDAEVVRFPSWTVAVEAIGRVLLGN